ncbi:hypothetical protein [Anatilimnocola floriformis]|uniref:hypothetical protein n=1 Tax=Anatilimnocola floriformis TaxID=2948575 RepID=UPI0020C2BA95|nr:hypothetical protein [Anatilimnocola floriformis]
MPAETARPGRNFLRFSLRTLLVGMVVCGAVSGFAARVHSRAQRQKQILIDAARIGGSIRYDYECYSESPWYTAQRWLAPKIGPDYVGSVLILNFHATPPREWRKVLPAAAELQSIDHFAACCEELEASDIELLSKFTRMKQIHFHYCSEVPSLEAFGKLQQLELLSIHSSGVTSAKLAPLQQLPNFKTLDLCNSDATDEVVPLLATFTALEELHAEGSEMTAAGLAGLSKSKSLRVLCVDHTQQSVRDALTGVTVSLK